MRLAYILWAVFNCAVSGVNVWSAHRNVKGSQENLASAQENARNAQAILTAHRG